MSIESLADSLLAMPQPLKWALATAGVAIGLPMILRPGSIIRGLRKWLLFQLRLVRRPGYLRMLRIYGWLLLVTGALLMILLLLTGGR